MFVKLYCCHFTLNVCFNYLNFLPPFDEFNIQCIRL